MDLLDGYPVIRASHVSVIVTGSGRPALLARVGVGCCVPGYGQVTAGTVTVVRLAL